MPNWLCNVLGIGGILLIVGVILYCAYQLAVAVSDDIDRMD